MNKEISVSSGSDMNARGLVSMQWLFPLLSLSIDLFTFLHLSSSLLNSPSPPLTSSLYVLFRIPFIPSLTIILSKSRLCLVTTSLLSSHLYAMNPSFSHAKLFLLFLPFLTLISFFDASIPSLLFICNIFVFSFSTLFLFYARFRVCHWILSFASHFVAFFGVPLSCLFTWNKLRDQLSLSVGIHECSRRVHQKGSRCIVQSQRFDIV